MSRVQVSDGKPFFSLINLERGLGARELSLESASSRPLKGLNDSLERHLGLSDLGIAEPVGCLVFAISIISQSPLKKKKELRHLFVSFVFL